MSRRSAFATALLTVASACALATGAVNAPAAGRSGAASASTAAPSGIGSAESARTIELATAPELSGPALPEEASVNLPGVPLATYRAAKAAARAPRRRRGAVRPLSAITLQGHAPLSSECAAGDGCASPSGINGAVGTTQVVTVTNSHIDVYTKAPNFPSLKLEKKLSTLLNYSVAALYDPRIEWDIRWSRWVVTADAIPEPGGAQRLFLAISQGSDATGAWLVYRLDVPGTFRDYPQVGLTQDGIVMTYNDFASTNGAQIATNTFAVPKAEAYNGLALDFVVYTVAASGTTTPTNVIDANPRMHELLEQPGGRVYDVLFQNVANGAYSSIASITPIPGVDASIPAQAPQPGSCSVASCSIDTGDGRFVNDAVQYDQELWATNTTADATLATPSYWEIWVEGGRPDTVKQSGIFFFSGTSSDWNASIVALAGGRVMVTWSYDDTPNGVNPSMAMSGRLLGDPVGQLDVPVGVFTSPHNLQGNYDSHLNAQRWGPTSSIRYDPGTVRTFGFNETVDLTGNLWSTHQGVLTLG